MCKIATKTRIVARFSDSAPDSGGHIRLRSARRHQGDVSASAPSFCTGMKSVLLTPSAMATTLAI